MHTSTQAVRAALQVKKWLVDQGITHIPHRMLLRVLLLHLAAMDVPAAMLQRHLRVTHFFAQRTPFILLLAGPPCALKTTLAQVCFVAAPLPSTLRHSRLCDCGTQHHIGMAA